MNRLTLENFLEDKEKFFNYQLSLIDKYNKSLIVINTNYIGNKKNIYTKNTLDEVNKLIRKILKDIIHEEFFETSYSYSYLIIVDHNEIELKKLMIEIEDNFFLGRLVDIDVYSKDKKIISRNNLNESARKCYICKNDAKVCSRNKVHDIEVINKYFINKYIEYISFKLSKLATKSLILELSSFPSFGLVSPISNGSHKDMNFFTFIDSSFSLQDYFYNISKLGFLDLNIEDKFLKARSLGKFSEKIMYLETNNVNTHKGSIFLLGILILVITHNISKGTLDIENIKKDIKKIYLIVSKDLLDLSYKNSLTHGEKIFLKYGIKGVREELKSGLSKLFDIYIPYYFEVGKTENNKNLIMVKVLLKICTTLDDTNIIKRGGIEALINFKKDCNKILDNFNTENLIIFEKECINKNLSPGGAADFLSLTIFIIELNKHIKLKGLL